MRCAVSVRHTCRDISVLRLEQAFGGLLQEERARVLNSFSQILGGSEGAFLSATVMCGRRRVRPKAMAQMPGVGRWNSGTFRSSTAAPPRRRTTQPSAWDPSAGDACLDAAHAAHAGSVWLRGGGAPHMGPGR